MDTQEQRTTEERIQKEAEEYVQALPESAWRNLSPSTIKEDYIAGATIEAARNKENAVALIRWMIRNTITEGVDESKAENLYNNYLFQSGIIEQNKKV